MLKCVVCEGNNIIKQGNVFVCQGCGCQYSLEEVKEMAKTNMGNGSETVAPDNSMAPAAAVNTKLDNLYILARRDRDNNNTEDAAAHYHEILLEDPNSWEAAFYSVYFTALNCKIGQIASAADNVEKCLDSTMDLILKNVPKEDQEFAYKDVAESACKIGEILMRGAKNTYSGSSYSNAGIDLLNRGVSCISIFVKAGTLVMQKFDDPALALSIFQRAKKAGVVPANAGGSVDIGSLLSIDGKIREAQEAQKEKQKIRNEEYWKEHADEKEKLNTEIEKLEAESADCKAKIDEINKRKAELPENAEIREKNDQKRELIRKQSQLGIFKGKEKKALQDQIDALEKESWALRDQANKKEQEIDEEAKPYRARLSQIQERIRELKNELTKDR